MSIAETKDRRTYAPCLMEACTEDRHEIVDEGVLDFTHVAASTSVNERYGDDITGTVVGYDLACNMFDVGGDLGIGWRVELYADECLMTPDRARALAAELQAFAELAERLNAAD